MFRPFALVGGRAVATWRLRRGTVEVEPFDRVSRRDLRSLEEDADAVVRWLGPRWTGI